jgi:hypothetical protein
MNTKITEPAGCRQRRVGASVEVNTVGPVCLRER